MVDEVVLKSVKTTSLLPAIALYLPINDAGNSFNLKENDKEFKIILEKNSFINLAGTFADFIIRDYVFFLVCRYLEVYNSSKTTFDRFLIYEKVIKKVYNMENNDILVEVVRKLIDFSNSYRVINLDGFMKFVMKDYDNFILDRTDDFIDEILAEEELCEFIDMLKFYIATEPLGFGTINISVNPNGEYQYYDSYGIDVTKEWIDIFYNEIEDTEAGCDDMLISLLVTMQPEKIIFHNIGKAKNKKLLRTIKILFEDRVVVCNKNCRLCSP